MNSDRISRTDFERGEKFVDEHDSRVTMNPPDSCALPVLVVRPGSGTAQLLHPAFLLRLRPLQQVVRQPEELVGIALGYRAGFTTPPLPYQRVDRWQQPNQHNDIENQEEGVI